MPHPSELEAAIRTMQVHLDLNSEDEVDDAAVEEADLGRPAEMQIRGYGSARQPVDQQPDREPNVKRAVQGATWA